MRVIVGLGNIGSQYHRTRHNAGFDVVYILAETHGIRLSKSHCLCKAGEGVIGGERVLLCQPQTYMNESGRAIVQLLNWHKAGHSDIILVYDDIDLPLGRIRVRANGGAGTHNGMRSIICLTGAEDFPRVRVGIGKPQEGRDLRDYVTGHYGKEEQPVIFDALKDAAGAVECIVVDGVDAAMARYNAL